jgi:hypothetical protein
MEQYRRCSQCGEIKPLVEFRQDRHNKSGYSSWCKKCHASYMSARWRTSPTARKRQYQWKHDQRQKQRVLLIKQYGGKCECCGESHIEFLAFDHISGDGNKHRKSITSRDIVAWLKKSNNPLGIRILCHNCNFAIGVYGYCPHYQSSEFPSTLP